MIRCEYILLIVTSALMLALQTFCKYRFYLEDKYTQTQEGSGMNPEYKHERKLDFMPATSAVCLKIDNFS